MSTTGKSASKEREPKAAERAIEVLNRQRLYKIDRQGIAGLGRAVLDRIGRPEATFAITFIRDGRMRELNLNFRGIDAPTDVLSFAYHEDARDDEPLPDPQHLGDLVISTETAARHARELALALAREIDHLVIHGTLHLAGYDHETDNGEMNRLERKLRRELLDHRSR